MSHLIGMCRRPPKVLSDVPTAFAFESCAEVFAWGRRKLLRPCRALSGSSSHRNSDTCGPVSTFAGGFDPGSPGFDTLPGRLRGGSLRGSRLFGRNRYHALIPLVGKLPGEIRAFDHRHAFNLIRVERFDFRHLYAVDDKYRFDSTDEAFSTLNRYDFAIPAVFTTTVPSFGLVP